MHRCLINPSEPQPREQGREDSLDERQDLVEVPNRRRDARHGRVDIQAGNEGERKRHDRVDDGGKQAEDGLDRGKDDNEDV